MTSAELAGILFGFALTTLNGLTLYVVNDLRARITRLENKAMGK